MNNINKISLEGFLDFAQEANIRSTLAGEDGLKPVHRRILYHMYNTAYKKAEGSAEIVGAVMGSYHPHGDSSVYDAAVRMSQVYKMRYPLIDFVGNSGSILEPDAFAAMRYTKMKLSRFGQMMSDDIEKDAVPFVENYNGNKMEPVVLPGIFPNLLTNGGMGIGVGLSNSLVPHNLKEICDGIEAYINKNSIGTQELMKYITGPDFPTGGIITDSSKLYEIYNTGKGTIKLRAKYHIENIGGRNTIIVTEIPFLVNVEDSIIKKIQSLVVEEGYEDIYDILNNSGKQGLEIHIILEKNVNVNKVLKKLFEETGLESTIKVNNTVYSNGDFMTLSLKGLIIQYVEHQYKVITRSTQFDLDKAVAKLHILVGLIRALEDIDNVINIIKTSSNKDTARVKLISHLSIDEIQANAILDMKLSKLTSLEVESLKQDIIALEKNISDLEDIIKSKKRKDAIIISFLNELRKLSDGRRTILVDGSLAQTTGEDVYIILKDNNIISAIEKDDIDVKNKGTKGSAITKDTILDMIFTNTKDSLYCLSDTGYIYQLPVNFIDIDSKSKGNNLEELLDINGKIIKFVKIREEDNYLITISKNGLMKKTSLEEINLKKAAQVARIKEGDSLFTVLSARENDNIIVVSDNHKVNNFAVSEIKTMGKVTFGGKAISANSILSCTIAASNDKLLLWEEESNANLVEFDDLPTSSKGSTGFVTTENCNGVLNVQGKDFVTIIGEDNKSITVDISSTKIKSHKASGSKFYNGKIDKIISM